MITKEIRETISKEAMGEGDWLGTIPELHPIRDGLLQVALQLSIQNDIRRASADELIKSMDRLCSHSYLQTAAIQALSGTLHGSR